MGGLAFITAREIVKFHSRVIADFGGDPGLRERGILESAAAMPRAMFAGEYLHPDVMSMAAAYHFHPRANHPFMDGNKRVGVATAEIFLHANGLEFAASDDEVVELTLGTANGALGRQQLLESYAERVRTR